MYIAMNEFKIVLGKEHDFEQLWRNRESHLGNVEGFIKFNLLKELTKYDSRTALKDFNLMYNN